MWFVLANWFMTVWIIYFVKIKPSRQMLRKEVSPGASVRRLTPATQGQETITISSVTPPDISPPAKLGQKLTSSIENTIFILVLDLWPWCGTRLSRVIIDILTRWRHGVLGLDTATWWSSDHVWMMKQMASCSTLLSIDEARVVAECGFCHHPRNNQYHYSHYRHSPAGSGTMITCWYASAAIVRHLHRISGILLFGHFLWRADLLSKGR